MIRKLLIIFLMLFTFMFLPAEAQEVLKINNINFDNSDTIIFLGTSGVNSYTPLSVTKGKLSNPDRVYIDIKDAVITKPSAEFELKNSIIDQLKIAQFSTNPPIVRIVFSASSVINSEKIKVFKHNNNLIIKLKDATPIQDYVTQIYRETKDSSSDFFEKTSIGLIPGIKQNSEKPKTKSQSKSNNDLFNQIEQAFSDTTDQMAPETQGFKNTPNSINSQSTAKTIISKEKRLRSRYFVDGIDVRKGNILISGAGLVNIDKPIYLTSPDRIVIDLPNTIVAQDIRNKDIPITSVESIKIAQFNMTSARIVITTPSPQKYRPVYSFDLQNILIAHDDRMGGIKLFNTTSEVTSFNLKQQNSTTDVFTIDFSGPIVHSIKRDSSKIEINLYNVTYFNDEKFKLATINTSIDQTKIEKLPTQGIKLTIPIKKEAKFDCYENLNATQLKLLIKNPDLPPPQPQKIDKKIVCPAPAITSGLRTIILDPGHGGSDTGAIRNGIAEKDITLDVARKTAAILTTRGYHVEMTRWNDATVSLQERVEFSNSKRTDAFVSIHINASTTPSAHGIETHYYTPDGMEIAKVIHKSIMSKIPETDRGLLKSRFYVINHTAAPSTLLELGFISNDRERMLLLNEERKRTFAEAIAEGIITFVNSQQKR